MDYDELISQLLLVWRAMHRISSHRKMDSFVQGEKVILNYLANQQEPALPSDLSSVMQMTTARVAAVLGGLERKGMIVRRRDEKDRRRIRVELTPLGYAQVMEERAHMHATLEKLLRELGEEDASEFLRILSRIVEISGRHCPQQDP